MFWPGSNLFPAGMELEKGNTIKSLSNLVSVICLSPFSVHSDIVQVSTWKLKDTVEGSES